MVSRVAFFLVVFPFGGLLACAEDPSPAAQTAGSGGASSAGSAGSSGLGGGLTAPGGSASSGGTVGDGSLDQGGQAGSTGKALVDTDSDTISDAHEGAPDRDTDGDGKPDYLEKDSDDDGLNDAFEAGDTRLASAPVDTDGDGTPDFEDTDSDDDGISDKIESASFDTDGDFIPDYLDLDSDNDDASDAEELAQGLGPLDEDSDDDGISDGDEGFKDNDGDGIINALDDDSDGDGVSDAEEAGDLLLDTSPIDSDIDGLPDFLDLDADGDGLPDLQEPACGLNTTDGDDDGYIDLVEVLTGADPCDDSETPLDKGVEFYFVLPYKGPEQSQPLRFVPRVQKADVFFDVDTTGSMGGVISSLKTGLASVMTSTLARVSDSAFGVASFEDFPAGSYGSPGDVPFKLLSGITTTASVAQAAANALALGGGADGPEAGYEALFQTVDGSGVSGTGGTFGPFTAGGFTGGAHFRPGALPIIVHATDAPGHDDYPTAYNAHGRTTTLAALTKVGARTITIQNGSDITATTQLNEISKLTRAAVPACSFKTSTTTWRCGTDMCCLPTATAPTLDSDGKKECVLRYGIKNDGTGLADVTADGIDAIIKYTKFDVFAESRDDGESGTPDTSRFLSEVEANTPDDDFKPPLEPEFSCNPVPKPDAFKGASYNNGFSGFAVGSSSSTREGARLYFSVRARNTTVKEETNPQVFKAYIDIVDEQTGVVLDSQDVVVIVPGRSGSVGIGE